MENNGDFGRFVCTNSSQYLFSVPGDKNGLSFLVQGGYLSHEKFVPCF